MEWMKSWDLLVMKKILMEEKNIVKHINKKLMKE